MSKSDYAVLTLDDGRQAAIMKKYQNGFEIMPLGGARFKPSERIDLKGSVGDEERTYVFVVGRRCGPGNRCFRIRIEGRKE